MIPELVFAASIAFGQAGQSPTGTSPATQADAPKEDPAVTALALKVYGQIRAGKVDPTLLNDRMAAAMTPEALAQSKPMFDQLGDPTKLVLEKKDVSEKGTMWTYLATFPQATVHIILAIDPAGKIAGYRLLP